MSARGVAVHDLEEEQVEGGDRVEDALAPTTSQGPTEVIQGEWFEQVGQVITDLPQGRCEGWGHDEDLPPAGDTGAPIPVASGVNSHRS
jgi:hypothetical protein